MANKNIPSPLLDKRVIERQLAKGALSREDYESYLKSLPDLEGDAENIADRVYGAEGSAGARPAGDEAGGEG